VKFCTWVRNLLPGYKTCYLGTKLLTWVQNFLPGYETFYLGTQLLTWVQNFLPGIQKMRNRTALTCWLFTVHSCVELSQNVRNCLSIWDRCYDFLNIFAENSSKKLADLTQNKAKICLQNFDHNIGFWEKRQFFCRKWAKIAENCDHNIDPWIYNNKKLFRLMLHSVTEKGSMLWSQFPAIFANFRRKKLALFSKTNAVIIFLNKQ
jgi:hypothetical protein